MLLLVEPVVNGVVDWRECVSESMCHDENEDRVEIPIKECLIWSFVSLILSKDMMTMKMMVIMMVRRLHIDMEMGWIRRFV